MQLGVLIWIQHSKNDAPPPPPEKKYKNLMVWTVQGNILTFSSERQLLLLKFGHPKPSLSNLSLSSPTPSNPCYSWSLVIPNPLSPISLSLSSPSPSNPCYSWSLVIPNPLSPISLSLQSLPFESLLLLKFGHPKPSLANLSFSSPSPSNPSLSSQGWH